MDKVLAESTLIVQFITELHPSHLSPTLGTSSETAHFRYQMGFIVDTYFNKVNPLMFKLLGADTTEKQEQRVDEMVAVVKKEIEPLLKDVAPYFGGRKKMTVVEVLLLGSSLPAKLMTIGNDHAICDPPVRVRRRHHLAGSVGNKAGCVASFLEVGEACHGAGECEICVA